MNVHTLSRVEARRIATRAQLLHGERPSELTDVVRHLTLLQLDPVAAIAPAADLVSWSRLGAAYSPDLLVRMLKERELVEIGATVRPIEDAVLYRAEMAGMRNRPPVADWEKRMHGWLEANDACRRDILTRLEADGPLLSRDIPDTCVLPWKSTGWTNDQNVIRLLGLMADLGEVAIAGRQGRNRLWDLAERVYPDAAVPDPEEGLRVRNERRLRSLGIARSKSAKVPVEPYDVGGAGEAAVVEGVKGEWRVDPTYLGQSFEGRTALLSPFDRLVHDRKRAMELFDFEFGVEMYKPAAKRRWGYFALPILFHDRLVGKLDATADRKKGVLRINAVHEDEVFTKEMTVAVDAEVDALAEWLELEVERS
ncbi:winged helix-turn-helix domain-containing protein [Streptomyces sp. SID8379]|uniref:DNA glycosylase AlkZ-like family protein n=1 Tax=unclassified Streptomyces TaxID=2593676 RepID=UPI0003667A2F|nr:MULTISPECIES: crosslink repair DNA glycosylase YcaQ family protein [unclassified Streptomyces]MYW69880.1 winged helix-turn-helix domain-containing protein [Streptomyces sp. SID8379]